MIITVTNRKGGTGKTVTCFMMGARLHQMGYRVLFIDLDSQMNLTFDLGIQNPQTDVMDVLQSRTAAYSIIKTNSGDLIASSTVLSGTDKVLMGNYKESRLKEALMPITDQYDFIIIDTAPNLDILTINALTASDTVIICAQAEVHSMEGISLAQRIVETVRKSGNPDLTVNGILLTRYNARTILSRDMKENIQALAEEIGTRVYNTAIRECTAIREAEALQTDIFNYNKRSNGAADYAAFVDEFLTGANQHTKKQFPKPRETANISRGTSERNGKRQNGASENKE